MKDRYINLFTDFGFKRLFGNEENKDILMDFLNTLLVDKQTITHLKFLNSEVLGKTILDRRAVYDLYCENDKGEKFIVELQRAEQEFFKERSIFYASRAIEEQSIKGEWNYNWQAVYTIAIMDFTFSGMGHDNVKSDVILFDQENKLTFTDKLRFIYLEMPKFNKTLEELETNYDKWLYILKNISAMDNIPPKLQKVFFKKVFQIAEVSNYTPQERMQYEESLKYYRDYHNSLDLKFKKGKELGKKEGIKEGKKEGIKEGIKEGKKEAMLETAKNMKNKGFDTKIIAELTSLTEQEIKNI
jgi:predicted transposase/invertase (TIGR01784 family)